MNLMTDIQRDIDIDSDIIIQLKKLEAELRYQASNPGISTWSTGDREAKLAELKVLQEKAVCVEIKQAANDNNWDLFCSLVKTNPKAMPYAFSNFFDIVPDNMKRELAIRCYSMHGDSFPEVRKAIVKLPRNGRKELPPDLFSHHSITIYRAGEEDIDDSRYRISWTTDINIAKFFLNTYRYAHAKHLYMAEIDIDDVIAYDNTRYEKEVFQYDSIYNIEKIKT